MEVGEEDNDVAGVGAGEGVVEQDRGRVDLTPFLNPHILGPHPGPYLEDADGWGRIDSLGVWECASSRFRSMEDVPNPYRKAWSSLLARILRRLVQAGNAKDEERAMKWFLVVAKLLLREPKRGGQKGQSSGEVAARFEAVKEGNWGSLLARLKYDEERMEGRRKRRQEQAGELEQKEETSRTEAKRRNTALHLVSRGQVRRCRRLVVSPGIADMEDPEVRATMRSKYPLRRHDMPTSVFAGTCMESLPALREALLDLVPGVSSGFGALRNEHLRCAGQNWDARDLHWFEEFGLKYLNVRFSTQNAWFYKVWSSVLTLPLFKSAARIPSIVRPVGIKSSGSRFFHREVMTANKGVFRAYLEPQQQALSPGGASRIVHTVRMMSEAHPEWPVVPMELQNAHNEISRRAQIVGLEKVPSLRHLALHVASYLAPSHSLECDGEEWGEAEEGHTQGDPEAGACFCTAIHPHVLALHQALAAHGGLAIFGNDDGYAIGPEEVVFKEVEKFKAAVLEDCGLTLQLDKTKVYLASREKPSHAPDWMGRAGELVEEEWCPGFLCYGVAIGSPNFVKHKLQEKTDTLCAEVDKVMTLLERDSQAALVLLSTSMSKQLDYVLTLQYSADSLYPAAVLEAKLWAVLEKLAGQPRIPRREEGLGVECVLRLPGIQSLEDRSYQQLISAQPVKLGGLGLRSLQETRLAAFIGGVEQAIPHMLGQGREEGLCPQLEGMVGKVEGQERWRAFLEAGSLTAQEFHHCWTSLAVEAHQMWQYLGKEPSGALAAGVVEAGGESVNGSTRTTVT